MPTNQWVVITVLETSLTLVIPIQKQFRFELESPVGVIYNIRLVLEYYYAYESVSSNDSNRDSCHSGGVLIETSYCESVWCLVEG